MFNKKKKKKQWELGAKLQVAKLMDVHHKSLDSLYDTCEALAKKMDSDSIPLKTLRAVIDLIKFGGKDNIKNG